MEPSVPSRVVRVPNRTASAPIRRERAASASAGTHASASTLARFPDTLSSAPFGLRKVTAEEMLGEPTVVNGRRQAPSYDPLSDPHLAHFYARKFGWTVAALPPEHVRGGSLRTRPGAAEAGSGARDVYTVEMTTSPRSAAPRSASPKYITFIGTHGQHGPVALAGPGVHFKPGATDTFRLVGPDIGSLTQVTLRNDCASRHDGWLLDSLTITRPGYGPVKIACNQWLSGFHGDGKTTRTLAAPAGTGGGGGVDNGYEMLVQTGDLRSAGTDANVHVTLFGEKGSTRVALSGQKLARNSARTFHLTVPRLGRLQKLVVEHDNSGLAPGWFLERVVVMHSKTQRKYTFNCHQWLAKDEGDGRLSRELLPTHAGGDAAIEYQINTFTGDRRYAGTDANVSIVLFGEHGEAGPFPLDTPSNNFERGQEDRFTVVVSSLGELKRVRVSHDNSGAAPGWFLDRVEVTDTATGKAYSFPCNRWLAADEDDGQISRELVCNLGTATLVPYKVHITTGDKRGAGTSAEVFCVLHGDKGDSSKVRLDNNAKNFERGRTDIFTVECSEIGKLKSIDIGHDNSGVGPGWYLERVAVECPTLGRLYRVDVAQWLATDEGDNKIERTIVFDEASVQQFDRESVWLCRVHTSDLLGAGTNARVFIVVYGDKGKSDEQLLQARNDLFERDQLDELKLTLTRVGKPYKVRVWHDNRGLLAAWHLDYIELQHAETSALYRFPCGDWLSLKNGGTIVRELPATGDLVKEPLRVLDYRVQVFTANKRGAGTDANVHITLFGKRGDTGVRQLAKSTTHMNKFESGQCDEFSIAAVDLDVLEKIRIGHDNSGAGPGWLLDRVVVENPVTGKEAVFPCGRWLDVAEDDGAIERELLLAGATAAATTTYVVSVTTGSIRHAGTDANVSIVLFGVKGDTGALGLRDSRAFKNKFERGHTDIFHIEAMNIGDIKKLRIGHDGAGAAAAWFLERVEIEVPSQGKKYLFRCNRWLSKSDDDGATERDLLPDTDSISAIEKLVPCEIVVRTSDVKGAGTDANVFVAVYGSTGKTEDIFLRNKTDNFERGQEDRFKRDLPDVGVPYKLRVGHDNKGLGAAWHLAAVELHDLAGKAVYHFTANRWLARGEDDGQIIVELPLTRGERIENGKTVEIKGAGALTPYKVEVVTGAMRGAGTDANVGVVLYGKHGDTGERTLDKSLTNRNKFERGSTDVFNVEAVALGPLHRVKVWHDNSGLNAGWFLESIKVTDTAKGKVYLFPCKRWLDKGEDDGLIMRELGLAGAGPDELACAAVTTNYRVRVTTSDVRYAGTDANVFVVLFGDKADSGHVPLLTSASNSNKFERGETDEFTVACADLGDLQKLRIGHDGTGPGAGWHLDTVEVEDPLRGKTWVFPCGRWLDAKADDGAIERVLVPSTADTVTVAAKQPYEIAFHTGDKRGASTGANVFIEVYGRKGKVEASDHIDIVNTTSKSFERAQEDRFAIEVADIGEPYKLRVGHDGTGLGAGWFLDKVILVNQATKKGFEFVCNRWLAKDEDDGEIVRELPLSNALAADKEGTAVVRTAGAHALKNYKIHVYTGDKMGAGTDANVFVVVSGSGGDSGERELRVSEQHVNKFERNQVDTFSIEAVDLGDLQTVKVWHDNRGLGANWLLDRIEIECDGDRSVFPCQAWLSSDKGHEVCKTLSVYVDPAVAAARAAAKAKEEKRQHKDDDETRSVAGGRGRTSDSKGSKGGKDGEGSKDGEGRASAASRSTDKEDDKARPATAAAAAAKADGKDSKKGFATYKVTVVTADRAGAGTDARVSIEIFGRKKVKASAGQKGFTYEAATTGVLALPAPDHALERGRTDTFELTAPDVGTMARLLVGHDGSGTNPNWFLDHVEVVKGDQRAVFPCSAWLSETQGDKRSERILLPTPQAAAADLTHYEVTIVTADVEDAGCAVPVSLWLYGDEGQSDELVLETTSGRFERRHADTFTLELESLGVLTKVRIGYTGTRTFRGWCLEKVVVRCARDKTETVFNCNDWLGGAQKDKPVRELVAAHNEANPAQINLRQKLYRVYVMTGTERGAGTDANVSLTLFGECGDSGEQKLESSSTHRNKFESGQTDVFEIRCADLGRLAKLRVWHDNAGLGASWFLDRIEVVEDDTTSKFLFPCGRWLSKSEDDHQIMREVVCQQDDVRGYNTQYKLCFVTAEKPDAEANCDVIVSIRGESRNTEQLVLHAQGKYFRSGQTDAFVQNLPALGAVQSASIQLAATGRRWLLAKFIVTDIRTGLTHTFVPRDPITPKASVLVPVDEAVGKAEVTRALALVKYEISVHTSDLSGAGTDANVSIHLTGANGDTGDVVLADSSTNKNKFERNQVDVFTIECLDLGKLQKLTVWHDNKGLGAAWHLDRIVVKHPGTGHATEFPCRMWLSKSDGDKQIRRELLPAE